MSTLLVLGGGRLQVPALKELRRLDYRVLLADRDPSALGAAEAHEFRPIDTMNEEALCEWAFGAKINGIMPLTEYGTKTAGYVSKQLGLPGNRDSEATTDKGRMRDLWAACDLPIPDYRVASGPEQIPDLAKEIGFPCVVKPALAGGGGRGVSVVRSAAQVHWACEFAKRLARNDRFVVERYVHGIVLLIETLSMNGQHLILAVGDSERPVARTQVATSLNYHFCLPDRHLEILQRLIGNALDALGHEVGLSHTEVIYDSQGAQFTLLETGGRPGGGHIFHPLIEAVSGISGPAVNAAAYTGHSIEIPPALNRGGVYRFFNLPFGIFRGCRRVEEIMQMPGVLDVEVYARPGQVVGAMRNSLDRPGFLVTKGVDRDEAIRRADAAQDMLAFQIEPIDAPNPYALPETA